MSTRAEALLKFLLRANGWLAVCAVFWVVMPHSWLAWCVHHVEPDLPVTTVVSYLARMVSGYFFLFGVLLIIAAGDVRKYRTLIKISMIWCWFMGINFAVQAWPFLSVLKSQPFFWFVVCDGFFGAFVTIWIFVLLRKMDNH